MAVGDGPNDGNKFLLFKINCAILPMLFYYTRLPIQASVLFPNKEKVGPEDEGGAEVKPI